jgi:hypothetical protein
MPSASMPTSVKNVALWRVHNRRRWMFERTTGPAVEESAPFVCECTSAECVHAVLLTMREYEEAHTCPTWLATLPGHSRRGDATRVVSKHPHFWIVELGGAAEDLVAGIRRARPAASPRTGHLRPG